MTEAQLLDGDAFNRLVVEKELQGKTWEQNGYIYAGFKGRDGYELYRTYGPKWRFVWTYKQLCTQDNVAGGNLVVTIRPAVGEAAIVKGLNWKTSGNRAIFAETADATPTEVNRLITIGAAAGNSGNIPSIGANATSSLNIIHSRDLMLTNSVYFLGQVTSAAQTETATIALTAVLTSQTLPTVSWALSGGTPNVTAAAINTLIPVLMP